MGALISRTLMLAVLLTPEQDAALNESIKVDDFTLNTFTPSADGKGKGKKGLSLPVMVRGNVAGGPLQPMEGDGHGMLIDDDTVIGWGGESIEGFEVEAIGDASDYQILGQLADGEDVVIGKVTPQGQIRPETVVNARIKKTAARQQTYAKAAAIRESLDIALNPVQDVTIAASTTAAQWSISPVEPGQYVAVRVRCVKGALGALITKLEVNNREQRILALRTNGSAGAGLTVTDGLRCVAREGGDVMITLPPANYSQSDTFKIYLTNDDTVNSAIVSVQFLRRADMPGQTDNMSS